VSSQPENFSAQGALGSPDAAESFSPYLMNCSDFRFGSPSFVEAVNGEAWARTSPPAEASRKAMEPSLPATMSS